MYLNSKETLYKKAFPENNSLNRYKETQITEKEIIPMNTMITITKKDLVRLGYGPGTSASLIRQAKLAMVEKGFPFYENKRLGRVPTEVIEELLGIRFPPEQLSETLSDKKEGMN